MLMTAVVEVKDILLLDDDPPLVLLDDAVLGLDVQLGGKVHEEDDEDGSEHDGRHPGVVGPVAGHADAGRGTDLIVGRVEQVHEGRGDDDAGAEVAGKQVDGDGDLERGDALRDDGEEGGRGGADQDDEDGRDARAQLAVVVVAGRVEIADDVRRVDIVEIYVGRVERGGHGEYL